jgi:hypothetical protein
VGDAKSCPQDSQNGTPASRGAPHDGQVSVAYFAVAAGSGGVGAVGVGVAGAAGAAPGASGAAGAAAPAIGAPQALQ